jgi:hypothetical protein
VSRYAGQTGSFALNLAKFAEQAQEAIDEALQEVVIELGNSLIRMSPVDTGRFRGNWQFSIGGPPSGTLPSTDPSGNETSAKIVGESILFKAGETAYIVNNLPYAIPLEYGHSDQAPGGMVRITLARFQAIVEEAIRNNKV